MNTINRLWHEIILGHGNAWTEINGSDRKTRKRGVLVECPCGKRWLSRMPWDRISL